MFELEPRMYGANMLYMHSVYRISQMIHRQFLYIKQLLYMSICIYRLFPFDRISISWSTVFLESIV